MKLKCPVCRKPLNVTYVCQNQHSYQITGGVLQLMTNEFKKMLDSWLINFEESRLPKLVHLEFDGLPDSGLKMDYNIWKARKEDIGLIRLRIRDGYKTALDVGSWNGWLANQLTKSGMKVTAVDYFVHELDGMGAKKFYQNPNWTSIQMDMEDLSVIDEQFDLIVLNRCYPYFTKVDLLLDSLIKMLAPKGQLIITGLNVVPKKTSQAKEFQLLKKHFKEQYDQELQFKPFKGFVDRDDLVYLKSRGFKIEPYLNLKNLIKTTLFPTKLVVYYALFTKQV